MSTLLLEEPKPESPAEQRSAADALADSVMLLLAMTVIQRVLGFGRGIIFCRWLDAEELGAWDVAYGFLQFAAPLAVLGLPGSFGRYVEYYRQRGHLRTFLTRTTVVSAVMAVLAMAVLAAAPATFSELIFGTPNEAAMVRWIAAGLGIVIFNNFLTSLFVAVRNYRLVSRLQFLQSFLFAVFSIPLLLAWQLNAESIVVAFALSSLVCCFGLYGHLRGLWQTDCLEPSSLPQRSFWSKLVPFAVWIWITNLLANLFEICDRYMIIHYSGLDSIDALRMVGNYHSSRIIPVLFVGIASMIGAMITPHLSCDWERGNRVGVIARLNMVTKTTALVQFAAAVAVLIIAPLLFEVAFRNKLSGGMHVLPWTLVYCSLFSLFAIVQNYLWCAERAGLSSLALLVGLSVTIGANFVLLPVYGLQGAVWSATCANIVALGAMYGFSAMLGMRFDRGTWILSIAPISVGLGLWPALGVLVALLALLVTTDWIFTAAEKRQLAGLASGYITKIWQLVGRRHAGQCVNSAAP